MRPTSILLFERTYWASFASDFLGVAFFEFPDPELGLAGSIIIFGATLVVALVLWFFIAIRASRVAKWIYLALLAAGVVVNAMFPEEFFAGGQISIGLTIVAMMLGLASVYFLFRNDARRWLATNGAGDVDPKIFD